MNAPLRLPAALDYPERADVQEGPVERWLIGVQASVMARGARLRAWRLRGILRAVRRHEARFAAMDEGELQAAGRDISLKLREVPNRLPLRVTGEAFALIREVSARVLGKRHYDVQVLGAWAMLRGQIAEMRTGEGKTLCATLAVTTAALAGRPVHVMSVNDYLTARDAEEMSPLYAFFGLSVGVVQEGQDADLRRALYRSDIVYGTNKEIAFDYLRDRAVLRRSPGNLRRKIDRLMRPGTEPLRLRGLHVAIIDEADSVLIDEARTPLIISGGETEEGGFDEALFREAMQVATDLIEGEHYRIPRGLRRIEMRPAGLDHLDEIAEGREDAFGIPVIREHAVVQALNALHIYHAGEAYLVMDGKVQIVDENTGRVMADRSWSDGLHQMVELKEGLEITKARETLSRITYQRLFRRYAHVGGMTGTARDAAWELWSVYRLAVAKIPTNKPDIRRFAGDRLFTTESRKWQAIAARAREFHEAGMPVLIGTRSVTASQQASARLAEAELPHQVLSAAQDADEAAVIAEAGQAGRITVATNMAGRGTDIKLGAGVAEAGGLAVILSERHDSRRVDRQLEGRCGRQGEPGRVEAFLSLEDELMRGKGAANLRRAGQVMSRLLGASSAGWVLRLRQKNVEALHAEARRDLLEQDRQLSRTLAVSGELE
ncbi:DEAD/DEAH box helicase [Pontivivens nitratireducens]|uniref:Protein translocase subunit SecA n=1 Tax=Pontivivens nitratireducens TaxID=2758038 RepID=A0A6G7VQR6_9RHOB|nr:DEAD/DEAH box helicase [Pontibrevibacter nitratireducens]QIK42226.1 translocase [Pontibrevibacter nitratireducens]